MVARLVLGSGQAAESAPAATEFDRIADANTRAFLGELSGRRRATTLFENPQSADLGVQENFVNTSAGNLTFLIRDLVRPGGMPVVMGRVYDSALNAEDEAAGDFGSGWKLAVHERVAMRGGRVAYTDAANATHLLEVADDELTPVAPALSPVSSGSMRESGGGAGIVVLESGGTIWRFKREAGKTAVDAPWLLVHVRHPRGWVRLDWRRGVVAAITSDAGTVSITRRGDGRIVAARDDLGRSVAYGYDGDGRLSTVTDLGGGTWRYRYEAAGALTAVVDPRGKTVLAASHADGRVSTVRALHAETTFHYAAGTTRAVDGLGRTTTFHRAANGMTTGVADAAGRLTQLAFDGAFRPVSITRDGAAAARMGYDAEGRLTTLWHPNGQSTFSYSRRGLTGVSGAETARYRYREGRVVHAADADGERAYAYGDDGSLTSTTVDGVATRLVARADGVVEEAWRDGSRLLRLGYGADGRVVTATAGSGDAEGTATYTYGTRGFRSGADYGGGVTSELGYDAAGNMVRYALTTSSGTVESQDYEIGDHNEVLRIRNGEGPDVSFEYDAVGRATGVQGGSRSAAVAYDDLDRAVRVDLDGEELVAYEYGRLDVDAALAADRLTTDVAVPRGTSAVFGTMESVVYARPRPMHYGPVRYEPGHRTFVATHRHLVPDAVLASSLDRRMIPWRGGAPDWRPFGMDKPSNSLFVPAEYRSVNCHICSAVLQTVTILVGGRPVAQDPLDILIALTGNCAPTFGYGAGPGPSSPVTWSHSVAFGDGASARGFGTHSALTHTYASAGSYDIVDAVLCLLCNSLLTLATAMESVEVAEAVTCTDADGDGRCECEDGDGDGVCDYCEDANGDGECDCAVLDGDGNCACEDVDGDGECDPPRIEIVARQQDYYIDRHVNMPNMTFEARLVNAVPVLRREGMTLRRLIYWWHLNMSYRDQHNSFSHRVPTGVSDIVFGRNKWQPRWNGLVAGAHSVTAHVSAQIGTTVVGGSRWGYRIKGENPSGSQIVAAISDPWYVRKVIGKESSCLQFRSGFPHKSNDGGYGLMQLTNPSPTEVQIWSWTANVAKGATVLDEKIGWANGHWSTQEKNWKAHNEDADPRVPEPVDMRYTNHQGGTLTFSYDSTRGYPLEDGLAIKAYNGNGCYPSASVGDPSEGETECVPGPWLEFVAGSDLRQGETARWVYNEGEHYVPAVAEARPCE